MAPAQGQPPVIDNQIVCSMPVVESHHERSGLFAKGVLQKCTINASGIWNKCTLLTNGTTSWEQRHFKRKCPNPQKHIVWSGTLLDKNWRGTIKRRADGPLTDDLSTKERHYEWYGFSLLMQASRIKIEDFRKRFIQMETHSFGNDR